MVTIVHAGPDDADLVSRAADLFDQPPVAEHIVKFLSTAGHHLRCSCTNSAPTRTIAAAAPPPHCSTN